MGEREGVLEKERKEAGKEGQTYERSTGQRERNKSQRK